MPYLPDSVTAISHLQGLSEIEKEQRIRESLLHLDIVKAERQFYNKLISDGVESLKLKSGCIHISFDFAQQVGIPFSSQQPGPVYFLSQFKVGLFGVAVEPLKKFYLYIIPESCNTGKGCNAVISLLHHFFENFAFDEVRCHADNCAAQNKNNILMKYLSWRVKKGLQKSIEIHFLPVGHTKFYPDLCFGLFKRKFRKSDCFSLKDVVTVATAASSTSNGFEVILVGNEEGDVYVNTYDWQRYFESTKTIPQLLSFNHFRMTNDGRIHYKTRIDDDEKVITLLPKNFKIDIFPSAVIPDNLSHERRKYVAEKLGPFVPQDRKNEFLWNTENIPKKTKIKRPRKAKQNTISKITGSRNIPKKPKINEPRNAKQNAISKITGSRKRKLSKS